MNVHPKFLKPAKKIEAKRALSREVKNKPLNLALQGGGAHGAFAWGVLDKILEDGRIDIDGLSATSAGAMNAAVYAYGKMTSGKDGARELLERFWRKVSETGTFVSPIKRTPLDNLMAASGLNHSVAYQLFETVTHVLSPYELNPFNFNPLRHVLASVVDFDELQSCRCTKLSICATNVRTGKARIFTNEEVTVDAVLASACLPMLFQAVEIEGEFYWDGGYIGNPAIYPLIYQTTTPDVLVVHINPIERRDVPKRASDIYNRINEISFNSSLMREMRAIAFVTKLIDDDWIKDEHKDSLRRIHVHAIRSDDVMSDLSVASKFETDWRFLTKLRDMGREAAAMWLNAHFGHVGMQSTIDIRTDYL